MYIRSWMAVFALLAKDVCTEDIFTNRFAEVRYTPTFIDKTLLIPRVFEHKYVSINAPHRFGKSTNIGMLSLFLSNTRTKETIEEYFNLTEIWKDQEFVQEHYGVHPVILFNTTVCGVVYDEEHMVATFQRVMYNTFLDHEYLLKDEDLSEQNREILKRQLNLKTSQCMTKEEVTRGVGLLAKLLHHHHGRPVIVLIDGFGRGVVERIIEDNTDLRYLTAEVVNWYSAIFEHITDSPHVERIISSGEIHPYGLNLPQFHTIGFMQNPKFSHFYGFTYDELEYLLCKFNVPLERRPEVLRWFCGYSSITGDVKVCNPQSILDLLQSPYHIVRVYSFSSVIGRDLLQRMIDAEHFAPSLGQLIQGNAINLSLDLDLTREVAHYRLLLEGLHADAEGLVSQVLLQTGVLTYAGHDTDGKISLKFPNEEIRFPINQLVSLLILG